jgi:alpha-L-rhamnosidase
MTAWGVVEVALNGVPVSDDVLTPGWSSYPWRLRYRSHHVTPLLQEEGVIVALLGNGWYRGRLGWADSRAVYGDELALILQLEIEYADGHVQRVVSDESWQAGPSDVLVDDLYDGQTIDARRRDRRCHRPGPAPDGWGPVRRADVDLSVLTPALAPPMRRTEICRPVTLDRRDDGRVVVDFGQNLVGWVRLRVRGPAGQEIVLRHAEVLENGELATRPLRTARATDRFVLSGGHDVFEPTLTFHGFRFVEVSGWRGELCEDDLEAVVVHSDLSRTGRFRCSDDLVNRLHDNVVWSTRGNFLDLPTDCPQRDERLGWTGDIAVFAPTAAFLFDVQSFLADWLRDLAVEQASAGGRVPLVVPDLLAMMLTEPPVDATAVWGDAAVWVPWAVWQAYGDTQVLADQFSSMAAHVDRVLGLRSERGLVDQTRELGDWLDPDAPADEPRLAKADPGVVATACLHRSVSMVAVVARVLDREQDAVNYEARAREVRNAFCRHYVDDQGRVESDAPTAYALAIEVRSARGRAPSASRGPAGRTGRGERVPHLHRLRRDALRLRCADHYRARRARLPAAAAAETALVALCGDDGCDDDLGAMGLAAARRLGEPG